ncbi:MAG: outer membrane beta-barrel protein [Bacteroidota bacterium]
MKRPIYIFFVFICLFLFTTTAYSQKYLGISAGADLYESVDVRLAAAYEWERTNALTLQFEIAYVRRENYSLLPFLPVNENHIRPQINYLELPILMKFKMHIEETAIYAIAGPKLGWGLSIASTRSNERGEYIIVPLEWEELPIQRWDFGVSVGLGFEKRISNEKKIFLEFRYYLGITDLNTSNENDVYNEGKLINLGFSLPLK